MRVRRGEGGAARGDSGWSLQGREGGKGRRREARCSPRRCLQGRGLARGHRFPHGGGSGGTRQHVVGRSLRPPAGETPVGAAAEAS